MIRAYLAGAGGLTGSNLYQLILQDARIASLSILNRNGQGHNPHPKGNGAVYALDHLPETVEPGSNILFVCLGTTMKKAGSKEAFMYVDFELPARLASWAERLRFDAIVWVSSVGADPASSNFYLSVKGKLESHIKSLSIPSRVAIRPSLLLGKRAESRPAERLAILLAPVFNLLTRGPLKKYKSIPAAQVAKAMLECGIAAPHGFSVVESPRLFQF